MPNGARNIGKNGLRKLKMNIDHYENAIRSINGIHIQGSHTDEEILNAETALSIKFPNEFIFYLKKFGCISFDGIEYYGLTGDVDFESSGIPNFVWFTLKKRRQLGFPNEYLIFKNDNGEIYYCLSNNENEIYIWDNIQRVILQPPIRMSFLEFMLSDLMGE